MLRRVIMVVCSFVVVYVFDIVVIMFVFRFYY